MYAQEPSPRVLGRGKRHTATTRIGLPKAISIRATGGPRSLVKLQEQDLPFKAVKKIETSVLVGWKAKTPARLCPKGMTSAPVDLEGRVSRGLFSSIKEY